MTRRDIAHDQAAEIEGDRRELLEVLAIMADVVNGPTRGDDELRELIVRGLAVLARMRGSIEGVTEALGSADAGDHGEVVQ